MIKTMKSKIRIIIVIIFLFLFLQPERVEAPLEGLDPYIAKNAFARAELVCAGKIETINQAESDTVTVHKVSLSGYWKTAQFMIDHVIKGESK